MAKKLDKILVVDVECTAWQGTPPSGERQEIIEIGVVLLDTETLELSDKRSILVRSDYSKVSDFCNQLTTLTQADVDGGVSFMEACGILRKEYRSVDRTFSSYGDFDRRAFERDCAAKGVRYPFGPTHLNVKNLFALRQNLYREVGMDQALRILDLSLVGQHHRGHDDAFNIGNILAHLLQK